ncbi:C6 transcription factor RosA [Aspergillus luchuensis]|uniref:C6 transcription factor RosA n=1 Tax=Aspergillus kawachii TaxID=1069201 RepID=A0A146FXV1_ASPKA|nr:C6 transcription factor RosA [Aspergillus luchuensis]
MDPSSEGRENRRKMTGNSTVALMRLAPSVFTSQDYISDHLWKASGNF